MGDNQVQQALDIKEILKTLQKEPKERGANEIGNLLNLTRDIPFFKNYNKEGDTDDSIGTKFYLILQGKVGVYIRLPKKIDIEERQEESTEEPLTCVKELISGQAFGELALLNNQPRLASIISHDITHLAVLDKKDFALILKQKEEQKLLTEMGVFTQLPMFFGWNFNLIKLLYLNKGDVIFKEGDEPNAAYIIVDGQFDILSINLSYLSQMEKYFDKEQKQQPNEANQDFDLTSLRMNCKKITKTLGITSLTSFELFGEEDIMNNEKGRTFSAVCQSANGELIMIKRRDFFLRILKDSGAKKYLKERLKKKNTRMKEKTQRIRNSILNFQNYLFNDQEGFRKEKQDTQQILKKEQFQEGIVKNYINTSISLSIQNSIPPNKENLKGETSLEYRQINSRSSRNVRKVSNPPMINIFSGRELSQRTLNLQKNNEFFFKPVSQNTMGSIEQNDSRQIKSQVFNQEEKFGSRMSSVIDLDKFNNFKLEFYKKQALDLEKQKELAEATETQQDPQEDKNNSFQSEEEPSFDQHQPLLSSQRLSPIRNNSSRYLSIQKIPLRTSPQRFSQTQQQLYSSQQKTVTQPYQGYSLKLIEDTEEQTPIDNQSTLDLKTSSREILNISVEKQRNSLSKIKLGTSKLQQQKLLYSLQPPIVQYSPLVSELSFLKLQESPLRFQEKTNSQNTQKVNSEPLKSHQKSPQRMESQKYFLAKNITPGRQSSSPQSKRYLNNSVKLKIFLDLKSIKQHTDNLGINQMTLQTPSKLSVKNPSKDIHSKEVEINVLDDYQLLNKNNIFQLDNKRYFSSSLKEKNQSFASQASNDEYKSMLLKKSQISNCRKTNEELRLQKTLRNLSTIKTNEQTTEVKRDRSISSSKDPIPNKLNSQKGSKTKRSSPQKKIQLYYNSLIIQTSNNLNSNRSLTLSENQTQINKQSPYYRPFSRLNSPFSPPKFIHHPTNFNTTPKRFSTAIPSNRSLYQKQSYQSNQRFNDLLQKRTFHEYSTSNIIQIPKQHVEQLPKNTKISKYQINPQSVNTVGFNSSSLLLSDFNHTMSIGTQFSSILKQIDTSKQILFPFQNSRKTDSRNI